MNLINQVWSFFRKQEPVPATTDAGSFVPTVTMLKRTRTGAASKEDTSPLLKLPGELRNRIYRYAVVSETPVFIEADPFGCHIMPGTPPLMLTCRKLYYEIKRIYYEDNTFCFTNSALRSQAIEQFSRMCGDSAARLRSVEVYHGSSHFAFLWPKPEEDVVVDIPALTRWDGVRRAVAQEAEQDQEQELRRAYYGRLYCRLSAFVTPFNRRNWRRGPGEKQNLLDLLYKYSTEMVAAAPDRADW